MRSDDKLVKSFEKKRKDIGNELINKRVKRSYILVV